MSTLGTSSTRSRARKPMRPTRAASRCPAAACVYVAQHAAWSGSAPRASSPATTPASTSPLPEVPRPAAPDPATAIRSTPAPARNAATPLSSAAPTVARAPPITSTLPRACLPPSGTGSGQSRSTPGVSGSAPPALDLGLPRDVDTGPGQVAPVVEGDQPQPVAVARPTGERCVVQPGGGEPEEVRLGELLDQVPQQP